VAIRLGLTELAKHLVREMSTYATFPSVVQLACRRGDITMLEILLDCGDPAPLLLSQPMGCCPLVTACKALQSPVVELLLSRKADVNVANRGGETPLMKLATLTTRWSSCSGLGIYDHGDPFEHERALDLVLKVPEIDLERRDPSGLSALLKAIDRCNCQVVEILLDKGALVDSIALEKAIFRCTISHREPTSPVGHCRDQILFSLLAKSKLKVTEEVIKNLCHQYRQRAFHEDVLPYFSGILLVLALEGGLFQMADQCLLFDKNLSGEPEQKNIIRRRWGPGKSMAAPLGFAGRRRYLLKAIDMSHRRVTEMRPPASSHKKPCAGAAYTLAKLGHYLKKMDVYVEYLRKLDAMEAARQRSSRCSRLIRRFGLCTGGFKTEEDNADEALGEAHCHTVASTLYVSSAMLLLIGQCPDKDNP